MSDEEVSKKPDGTVRRGDLDKFFPGGELGPITNKDEYEAKLKALPPEQQELAEESSRLADLWQYCGDRRIQLLADVVAEVGELAHLSPKQKTETLRRLNRTLMEYLNDVGEDSGIRQ